MDAISVLSPLGIIIFVWLQATQLPTTYFRGLKNAAAVPQRRHHNQLTDSCSSLGLQEGWGVLISVALLILLIRRGIHHAVGKIIFPAQNIAKDCNSYLQQLLLRSGIEENLIGAQGIEELRRRKARLLEQFRGESLLGKILTPEGYSLDGAYFRGVVKGGYVDPSDATAIYFNANMQLFESASAAATVRMYVSAGVNVILFNYRGVGESEGALTRDGVIIDGDAVVQYVKGHLQVPEHKIICHARSIGGGIANAVARLHPRVSLANERSFSSLLEVIRIVVHKFLGVSLGDSRLPTPSKEEADGTASRCGCRCQDGMRRCLAYSVTGLAGAIGWDFAAASNWSKITGSKWLLYHPRDAVIPLEASLYHAVVKEGAMVQALRMPGEQDGHNRPLSEEEKEWHMGMVRKALTYVTKTSSKGSSKGAYGTGANGNLDAQGFDAITPGIYSSTSARQSDSDQISLLAPPPFGDGAGVEMGPGGGAVGGQGYGATGRPL